MDFKREDRPGGDVDDQPESDGSSSQEDFVHVQEDSNAEMSVLEADRISDNGETFEDSNSSSEVLERSGVMETRRTLPEELSKNVVVLECESSADCGSCDVYLIGTSHVSEDSCREVHAIIDHLKPEVVFLELCAGRKAILRPQSIEVPSVQKMLELWKKNKMNAFGILYSWLLVKVASKLEVVPGAEFRTAFEIANSYGGMVILGDRPVHITLKRTWRKMSLWHRIKFLLSILFQGILLPDPEDLNKMLKEMNDVDMLTLMVQELNKEFPSLMETIVYERDLYMSSTLLEVASEYSSVVAVVGKGHLSGIKKHWKQPVELKKLLEIPPSNSIIPPIKTLLCIGVAVAGVAVVSRIYLSGNR